MKTHRLINPNDSKVTAIQSRHHTSLELISEYASQMADGLQFDPCSAIETPDGHLYIWDGKHRLEAAIRNGSMLLCELEPGTEQDARWKACSANKKHGLKRSNADIQQAVQEAVKLRPDKSDREIGLWVGCDHKTVGKYRKDMEVSGEIPQIHTRTVVRGEQEYQMEMPIKTEPVETPELNQPVRHLTGFVPADIQSSTQKSLALTPRHEQEDTATNAPAKPTPTQQQLKSIVKAFMGLEFDTFPKAYEELGHLCNCWQSQEPYVSLVNRLTTHLESLYAIDYQQIGNVFALRDACRAAYDDWTALYNSGYRGVLEPGEGGDEDAERQEALEQHVAFEARLERCRACVGKYYLVAIDGGHGIAHIYEINTHLAKIRGVTYPYPAKSQKWAAMTENFELKHLLKEVSQSDWELAKQGQLFDLDDRCERQTTTEPDTTQTTDTDEHLCSFCMNFYDHVYYGDVADQYDQTGIGICRTCAAKAQIALLHPNDPDVIAECHQVEQENIHDFRARRSRDLDKILQAGTLKVFSISEHEKLIKQYTIANSTIAEVDKITWGSWKTFERFDSKKAMMERVRELEQASDVIFDGRL